MIANMMAERYPIPHAVISQNDLSETRKHWLIDQRIIDEIAKGMAPE